MGIFTDALTRAAGEEPAGSLCCGRQPVCAGAACGPVDGEAGGGWRGVAMSRKGAGWTWARQRGLTGCASREPHYRETERILGGDSDRDGVAAGPR